jgi:hypothetical protein
MLESRITHGPHVPLVVPLGPSGPDDEWATVPTCAA